MEHAKPIRRFIFSSHAIFEMQRRGLTEDLVRRVLLNPEQRYRVRQGRDVLQSRVEMENRLYLIRVFVDTEESPAQIVTAYRTSKVEKYWK